MAGIYGIDPILNYTFTEPENNSILRGNEVLKPSPPNSLMSFLNIHHPKFAYIVKKAEFERIFGDELFRGTLFLPKEESLDENVVMNMDINTSRNVVEYHVMNGFYPKNVLTTSSFQQLQPRKEGHQILASIHWVPFLNRETVVLNNIAPIEIFDIKCINAYVHVISQPL
jgi:hypothetical protein